MRGHVRKRGKKWAIVIDIGTDQAGKRQQKWHSGYRTKADAEDELPALLTSLSNGSYVKPTKLTVKEYLEDEWFPALEALVVSKKLRRSTADSYKSLAELHVIPRLGRVVLRNLRSPQLNTLYAELLESGRKNGKGGLSSTSVHLIHITIHRALRDAVRWDRLDINHADRAEPPRPARVEMKVWAPAEIVRFLTHVESDRLRAMWVLVAATGLRRGELAGLRWVDVDLEAGTIVVRQARVSVRGHVGVEEPKTEKGRRHLGLDPRTVAALRTHRKAQLEERLAWGPAHRDSGLVFTREDGAAIHPHLISQTFQRHVKAAKLPRIRLHDVRHSYATAALEAGVDLKIVSVRMGHSKTATTADIYQHVRPEVDQSAANTVADWIFGPDTAASS